MQIEIQLVKEHWRLLPSHNWINIKNSTLKIISRLSANTTLPTKTNDGSDIARSIWKKRVLYPKTKESGRKSHQSYSDSKFNHSSLGFFLWKENQGAYDIRTIDAFCVFILIEWGSAVTQCVSQASASMSYWKLSSVQLSSTNWKRRIEFQRRF